MGDGQPNYSWDAADRLTTVTGTGLSASYQYDAADQRVSQTLNSVTTTYLWDPVSPYGDVVAELSSVGEVQTRYLLAEATLLKQTQGSASSAFLRDGQGSTRALVD